MKKWNLKNIAKWLQYDTKTTAIRFAILEKKGKYQINEQTKTILMYRMIISQNQYWDNQNKNHK